MLTLIFARAVKWMKSPSSSQKSSLVSNIKMNKTQRELFWQNDLKDVRTFRIIACTLWASFGPSLLVRFTSFVIDSLSFYLFGLFYLILNRDFQNHAFFFFFWRRRRGRRRSEFIVTGIQYISCFKNSDLCIKLNRIFRSFRSVCWRISCKLWVFTRASGLGWLIFWKRS